MSKGEVLENLGEGLYRVRIDYAKERLAAEMADNQERITELDTIIIPEERVQLAELEDAVSSITHEIDELIPGYRDDPAETTRQIAELQKDLVKAAAEASKQRARVDELTAELLSLRKRQSFLEDLPDGKELEAWCADYSTELNGTVGLVDVTAEGGGPTLVQPGFDGGAEYLPQRDGQMISRGAQSGPQVFFNAALLPGVQKWLPRYRLGEIVSLEGDLCDVELDQVESSAQGLNITRERSLIGVPIMYMDCHGAAFEEGDRVLVRFTASGPLVVGFESEPRACELLKFCFEPSEHYLAASNAFGRRFWGMPLETETGEPINPPLGTEGGTNPVWTAEPGADPLMIEKQAPRNYGNRNWVGAGQIVLSWDGPPSRVFDNNPRFFNPDSEFPHLAWQSRWYTSGKVYKDLQVLLDLSDYQTESGDSQVHGAAIHETSGGTLWLYIIASPVWFQVGQQYRAYRIMLSGEYEPIGELEYLHELTVDADVGHVTHWYFNRSGDKAVCTLRRFSTGSGENRRLWAVGRYDNLAGFSYEVVWDNNEITVGTSTTQFDRVVDNDTQAGRFNVNQDYSRQLSGDEYLEPIYWDFKGNQEVMVSLRLPQRTESNVYEYESLVVTETGAEENWRESTQNISEAPEKPLAIVTSDGKTLAEFPLPEQRTFYRYAREDNLANTITVSHSESRTESGFDVSHGIVAIDARFGFVAVGLRLYQETTEYSGTMPYEPGQIGTDRYADFPGVLQGSISDEIRICIGGDVVETIVLEEGTFDRSPIRVFSESVMPNPDLQPADGSSDSFTETESITPTPPRIYGNLNMLSAGGYHSGGARIAGVGLYDTLLGRDQVVVASHLTGYASVPEDLLGRSSDDLIVLHRLGLF